LILDGVTVVNNTAQTGGGVDGFVVRLRHGTSIRHNVAVSGGGVAATQCHLRGASIIAGTPRTRGRWRVAVGGRFEFSERPE
jgi:hypothetical protein